MNELIRIDNDNKVSGRELHDFLEVGRDFTNWMKQMIGYGFSEHADYEVYAKNGENPSGGRPSVDYSMTIDMAKEICMIQRTEKGKQARQYFIECERRAKANVIGAGWAAIPQTLPEALRLAADLAEAEAAHQHRIQAAARGDPAQRCGIESQQGVADDGYPQQIDDGKGDAEFAAGKHRAGEKGKAEQHHGDGKYAFASGGGRFDEGKIIAV